MADLTTSPTSHSFFSQRMRLHYLDWGNAAAPDLLMVHGSQDHAHNWDWMARRLVDRFHIVAPDFRGHGDSAWALGGAYTHYHYIYELAQLVNQTKLWPKTVIAHSLGGTLALQYAGVYPERIERLVIIEGVGLGRYWRAYADLDLAGRMRQWIDQTRQLSGRTPRRYASLEEAHDRMRTANPHLNEEQARHLTVHGSNRNEDGTHSWKFDNYTYSRTPFDISDEDTIALWERIDVPVLFINGRNGFGHRVGQDDTLKHFRRGRLVDIDDAGHWVHHDQLEEVMALIDAFVAEPQ